MKTQVRITSSKSHFLLVEISSNLDILHDDDEMLLSDLEFKRKNGEMTAKNQVSGSFGETADSIKKSSGLSPKKSGLMDLKRT